MALGHAVTTVEIRNEQKQFLNWSTKMKNMFL